MPNFSYLSEKVRNAEILHEPLPHLEIRDFLRPDHLEAILSDPHIHFEESASHEELITRLMENGFNVTPIGGCIEDIEEYLERLRTHYKPNEPNQDPIDSEGLTVKLEHTDNEVLKQLIDHVEGDEFQSTLKAKFDCDPRAATHASVALHKNLTGYQISPHPDKRNKCMTLLLTLNRDDHVAEYDCNTHLLRFKREYEYIYDFWDNHEEIERNWVPWDWCETRKSIKTNNTMLVFPPSNRSLHAVRLEYPHTRTQRTVLRGTIFFSERGDLPYLPNKYKSLERLRPGGDRLEQVMGADRFWPRIRRRMGSWLNSADRT